MTTLGRTGLLEADLHIITGTTNTIRLQWLRNILQADGNRYTHPVDLSEYTPHCQLRRDGHLINDLSDDITTDKTGHITIHLTARRSLELTTGSGAWDLLMESPNGETTRVVYGNWRITQAVSRKEEP